MMEKKKAKPKTEKKVTNFATRGREFVGKIIRMGSQKSAVIQWERSHYIPKYERYEKRWSKIAVHIPDDFELKVGDTVKVAECRPISKTKHFIVMEKI